MPKTTVGGFLPASVRILPVLAALVGLSIGVSSRADVVVLKDSMELRGRVVHLGGNAIELHLRSGVSRHIFLRDIKKVTFDLEGQGPSLVDKDIVFRRSGAEIAGDVGYSEDGKSVVVSQPDGSQVSIPRDDVIRIIARDQARHDSGAVCDAKVRDSVKAAVASILAGTGDPAPAEERLRDLGIFAIEDVREARKKAPAGSPAVASLDRVVRSYRIKELTSDFLQEIPDFYKILDVGTADDKSKLLVEMFTLNTADAVPLAKLLILDRQEDHKVRALGVALLGQYGLNRDLIEIYNDPAGGQIQLAAAIALAKNRILVGAEALIQGLEMERAPIRELAFKALRQASGKDFGFGPNDTPSARKESIERWKKWWTENREAIRTQTAGILAGRDRPEDTAERKKSMKLWQEGCLAMDRGKNSEAESRLRAALAADPTFFNAQISLGVFLVLRTDKDAEGRRLLEDLLERKPAGLGADENTWIHYYLGRALEISVDFEKAELEYRNALSVDPRFFRAMTALGDLKLRAAIAADPPATGDRRMLLAEAERQYHAAIAQIEEYANGISILAIEDLPPETAPVFQRQEHNRTVIELKASLRLTKAEAHFNIAKIRSLLDDRPRALENLASAIETLGDDRGGGARELLVDLHNYRGLLLEAADRPEDALVEYRAVIAADLDPKNATAIEGVRRLAPRGPAPGPGRPSRIRKAGDASTAAGSGQPRRRTE
jgi:tetratricopeptide (TPR) repeat protein